MPLVRSVATRRRLGDARQQRLEGGRALAWDADVVVAVARPAARLVDHMHRIAKLFDGPREVAVHLRLREREGFDGEERPVALQRPAGAAQSGLLPPLEVEVREGEPPRAEQRVDGVDGERYPLGGAPLAFLIHAVPPHLAVLARAHLLDLAAIRGLSVRRAQARTKHLIETRHELTVPRSNGE